MTPQRNARDASASYAIGINVLVANLPQQAVPGTMRWRDAQATDPQPAQPVGRTFESRALDRRFDFTNVSSSDDRDTAATSARRCAVSRRSGKS
jgi:hypothetical protein